MYHLVRVDYETGHPRPSEQDLLRITDQLTDAPRAKTEVKLPRGDLSDSIWATVWKEPAAGKVVFNTDRSDFEVFGATRVGISRAIQVFVYPTRNDFPNSLRLIAFAEQLEVNRGTLILFYLPTMNPEARPWCVYRTGDRSSFKSYPERAPLNWRTNAEQMK